MYVVCDAVTLSHCVEKEKEVCLNLRNHEVKFEGENKEAQ